MDPLYNAPIPLKIRPHEVRSEDHVELTDSTRPEWLVRDKATLDGYGEVWVSHWEMSKIPEDSSIIVTLLNRPKPAPPTTVGTYVFATTNDQEEEILLWCTSLGEWEGKEGYYAEQSIISWRPAAVIPTPDLAEHAPSAAFSLNIGSPTLKGIQCSCGERFDATVAFMRHVAREWGIFPKPDPK